jgi:phosphoribosylformimino-5-aminoimidazole carboxamide ribotide isomerase
MLIIPAIDLLAGEVVRLKEGQREQATVYSQRPWELAGEFTRAGARRLHVVDLDGAFAGRPVQAALVTEIVAMAGGVPVEVGGGVRDQASLEAVFATGAALAVLGTAAIREPAFVEAACRRHPGRVVVAVDARDGKVAVDGWTSQSEVDVTELALRAVDWGAESILYTDIARDGLRSGPNLPATERLQKNLGRTPVIASGGISSLDDLRALQAAGVAACIIGRALYDGVFTIAEALAAC